MTARKPPCDFERNNHLRCVDLIKKYHCSHLQIRRWRDELGLPTPPRGKFPPRPCVKIDLYDGRVVGRYHSVYEAAKSVRGSASNISFCLNGVYLQAYGYRWEDAQ